MSMDEELVQEQIDDTINRLTQLLLLDVRKQHNLPTEGFEIPEIPQALTSEIETGLYKISTVRDFHEVQLKLELDPRGIEKKMREYATKRCPEPDWTFLAFFREGAFSLSSISKIKSIEELIRQAEFSSQTDVHFPLPNLKQGISYSALFLVVFESDEAIGFEADKLTVIQAPQKVMQVSGIKELKDQLIDLMSSGITAKPTPPPLPQHTPGFDENYKKLVIEFKLKCDTIMSSDIPEEMKEGLTEELRFKLYDELSRMMKK